MKALFLNCWEDATAVDVFTEFDGDRWSAYRESDAAPVEEKPQYVGVEILLASYSQGGYEGDAFVLFRKEGKLYEVNGGHCSCYGLEGQWTPEETTKDALRHRLTEGNLGSNDYCGNNFATELSSLLDALEQS